MGSSVSLHENGLQQLSTTFETPNRVMLCRELKTPVTLLAPSVPNQEADVDWMERQKILKYERRLQKLQRGLKRVTERKCHV